MDFDNIPDTQVFEGNTVDIIFHKKARRPRDKKTPTAKRNSIVVNLPATQSTQESPAPCEPTPLPPQSSAASPSQTTVPDLTNDRIFMTTKTSVEAFNKHFPPEALHFNDAELAELNALYHSLIKEHAQAPAMLNPQTILGVEKSSLIERFLKDNLSNSEESTPPIPPFDSCSPIASHST